MNEEKNFNKSLVVTAPFVSDRILQKNSGRSLDCEFIDAETIYTRIEELKTIEKYFSNKTYIDGVLITIYYKRIIPKSSRVLELFSYEKTTYESIVGSKFGRRNNGSYFHVITHYISKNELDKAIKDLEEVLFIVQNVIKKPISKSDIKENLLSKDIFHPFSITKTKFIAILADISAVSKFDIEFPVEKEIENNKIVTLFNCLKDKNKFEQLLDRIGVPGNLTFLSENNLLLTPEQFDVIYKKVPYLICMLTDDIAVYEPDETHTSRPFFARKLPSPTNEPIIGCFDTLFEKNCYLKEYVDFESLVSPLYDNYPENRIHGTIIDSILVEGNELNPQYNDNCGRFRVKHFGVGGSKNLDIQALVEGINKQVEKYHKTIKVWNISLGDARGIDPNCISLLASEIDKVSRKFDVLFVLAGTNICEKYPNELRIGSPADSLNALVVNSVVSKENPISASYTRTGPVLTFVNKPDVSYYGGDEDCKLNCYSPNGDYACSGTSIAAPLIARKAAFLIYKMHLSPQCAKALIIDSACGWDGIKNKTITRVGYGIPAVSVNDIVNSKRDEVKIVISGFTKNRYTLVHDFPIVIDRETNKLNYYAKLVFCYFTYGNRNKGVDYASQDISIDFGRVGRKVYKTDGKSHYYIAEKINEIPISNAIKEAANITEYKKWNNTKIFIGSSKQKSKTLDYSNKTQLWGIRISHLDRFRTLTNEDWENDIRDDLDISTKFGIVITFRTRDGSDADIEEFLMRFKANPNYTVKELDIQAENRLDNQLKKKIEL